MVGGKKTAITSEPGPADLQKKPEELRQRFEETLKATQIMEEAQADKKRIQDESACCRS